MEVRKQPLGPGSGLWVQGAASGQARWGAWTSCLITLHVFCTFRIVHGAGGGTATLTNTSMLIVEVIFNESSAIRN